MTTKDLLFEIGTEELPTKAVKKLSNSLVDLVSEQLNKHKLNFKNIRAFGAPRRIGFLITALQAKQQDYSIERRGPALKAAFDKEGNYTKAAEGFAKSCNISPNKLQKLETENGSWLVHNENVKGQKAEEIIPEILVSSIKKLPITKPMRWADHDYEFVRPVHWVLLLFGNKTIKTEILGLKTNNKTYGHRFHSNKAITIQSPGDYENELNKNFVIANFTKRLETIKTQVQKQADLLSLKPILSDSLLEEVTSLVEWPVALTGEFDKKFLDVPQECLISTMVNNQKYFALVNNKNKLQPYFIFISNIKSLKKQQVISGNERVLSARLSDAEFFFNNDKKILLIDNLDKLKTITYQQQLGSLYDKTKRVELLSKLICKKVIAHAEIEIETETVARAALLSKSDLVTEMVFEFPELQGIMGKYYAKNNREPDVIADCIEQHYLPKQAGDKLPESIEACIVAIADKIDTILGIFTIGKKPSGDKDPFGLRRAALGILRMLIEKNLPLDLKALFEDSIICHQKHSTLPDKLKENLPTASEQCVEFCFDRLKKYYQEKDISVNLYHSVVNSKTSSPYDFDQRITAVYNFLALPQAEQLIAANKRVKNILNKQDTNNLPTQIVQSSLHEEAEISLYNNLNNKNEEIAPLFISKDYNEILKKLSSLQSPIDNFFDNVMVMSDNEQDKTNRLLLLKNIQDLFNKVADISELQS